MSLGSRNRNFSSHLWARAGVIQAIRSFFVERDFLEVETPLLISAPAPEPHIDAIATADRFLHTSPELCMKQLLAAGFPRIFQVGKCFREGERGRIHLPEFTLLEWYEAGIDYKALMETCEALIRWIARKQGRGDSLRYRGSEIGIEPPWERLSVEEAFARYASVSLEKALGAGLFDEVMVRDLEPRLGHSKPVFLYDYPASLAALARLKGNDPRVAERFELYLGGLEIANAFSELTDVREQRNRFEKDAEDRRLRGKRVYPVPERFLASLEGMPDAAGIALGVDRLVMVFTDTTEIDQVVSFVPEEV
jgi:elongation factor P--(R)-beta-lysine ligase